MRKLLLLLTTIILFTSSAQANIVLDPKSPLYAMYFSTEFNVESISVEGASMYTMFNEDLKDIDQTKDSIYWVFHKGYYKLWWSEYHTMFIVKPTDSKSILGDHLISLITLIRNERKKQQN